MDLDQPYPGSFQFEQQAPPITSVSRGYHMHVRTEKVSTDKEQVLQICY